MKTIKKSTLYVGLCLIFAYVLWTILLCTVDRQPIGPNATNVGLATINRWFHNLTGVHLGLYTVTDCLGLIPIAIAISFALSGTVQLIRRKSLFKVDYSILVLGIFYLVVIASFFLFETVIVNYRPILLNDCLESSYPSSTTLLATCVLPTAIMQLNARIHNRFFQKSVVLILSLFTAFIVIARLLSGVHWLTDIIGGLFLSAGLVIIYYAFCPTDLSSHSYKQSPNTKKET